MMGFAAGVMIAASFGPLLAPSLAYASQNGYGKLSWFPAAAGFLLGGVALRLIDAVVPHLHLENDISKAEGIQPHEKIIKNCPTFFGYYHSSFQKNWQSGLPLVPWQVVI